MSDKLDWLPAYDGEALFGNEDESVYRIEALRDAGLDIRELPGGWLVLKRADEKGPSGGLWLNFAVLQFHTSIDEGEFATCLFFGDGPGGKKGESLRECRHTYWGENGDGYIFYPEGKLIIAALRALSEFYDDVGDE